MLKPSLILLSYITCHVRIQKITQSAPGVAITRLSPSENCPSGEKEKYIENRTQAHEYIFARKFFWMKLYYTNDQLLFEGLKYSDCTIGPFICYWPDGKIKTKGQYDGYSYSEKKGYKLKNCSGKKTGVWEYNDESGTFLKNETY